MTVSDSCVSDMANRIVIHLVLKTSFNLESERFEIILDSL